MSAATHYRPWEPLFAPEHFVRGSAMVVAPHPDDEVIGPGGLVIAHRDRGEVVHSVVMTDGALGDAGSEAEQGYRDLRVAESRAASERLGGTDLRFLAFADGNLAAEMSVDDPSPVRALVEVIEECRPSTLLFPSPYEIHPDHRATALAVAGALRRISGDWPRLLAYEVGAPMLSNALINISDRFSRKREALACFASQLEHHDLLSKLDALNRMRCVNCDDPLVTHAEAYLSIEPQGMDPLFEAAESVLRLGDGMAPPIPGG